MIRKVLYATLATMALTVGAARAEDTIVWWDFLSGGDGVRMKAMLEEFNKEHAGKVKIDATTSEWGTPFYTKAQTAAATGQGPDVMTYHESRMPLGVSEGVVSPPHESAKCLTADETRDLATTFSPVPRMINSECTPIERTLDGARLNWHLVCKGQLNVELTGAFNFDSARHYTATVRTQAAIGGQTIDSLDMLEGQWVSACQ